MSCQRLALTSLLPFHQTRRRPSCTARVPVRAPSAQVVAQGRVDFPPLASRDSLFPITTFKQNVLVKKAKQCTHLTFK